MLLTGCKREPTSASIPKLYLNASINFNSHDFRCRFTHPGTSREGNVLKAPYYTFLSDDLITRRYYLLLVRLAHGPQKSMDSGRYLGASERASEGERDPAEGSGIAAGQV